MRKAKFGIAVLMCLVLVALVGCSLLNLGRTDLTEDEKVRIAIDVGLTSLDVGFTAGVVAVTIKPEFNPIWISAVVPSFTAANHVALDLITIGEAGDTITEAMVISSLQARAFEILSLIAVWETQIAKSRDAEPVVEPPVAPAETTYPPIPTYAQLRIKSGLLQAKIDSVK